MITSSWRSSEAIFAAHNATRRPAPLPGDWTPPTGDTQHVIYVARDEMTCLGCGETFTAGSICTRCNERDEVTGERTRRCDLPPAVPTASYLRPGEYEAVR